MSASISSSSHILEYIALGSAFFHCCMMFFNSEVPLELNLLFYTFVLANLLINNYQRGTRVHFYPLISGFALYSVALLFGIF